MREHACKAVWHTKNAVKHTNVQRMSAPVLPIRMVMICKKADPDGPGRLALHERSAPSRVESGLYAQVARADDHGDVQQPAKETGSKHSDEDGRRCGVGGTTDLL